MQAENFTPRTRKRRSVRRSRFIALASVDEIFKSNRFLFRTHLISGIQSVLDREGYRLQLPTSVNRENIAQQSKGIDAWILSGFDPHPEQFAEAAGVPIVWMSRNHSGPSDSVAADDREIARLAAEYFVGRNHRRVGYLEDAEIETLMERRLHLTQFLSEKNGEVLYATGKNIYRPVDPQYDLNIDELRRMLKKLLTGRQRPTALFVPSDRMCASVYGVLQEMGIRPQKDIDILSCNRDEDYLQKMVPTPAVIDINFEAIGRRIAECALWRLANPEEPPMRILVRPSLLIKI